jgi:copper chaperone CopZ
VTAAARTEVVEVRGMHCGGCERTVREAVGALAGVERADADFVAEEVAVTFDPGQVGLDEIRAAVRDAGFSPA